MNEPDHSPRCALSLELLGSIRAAAVALIVRSPPLPDHGGANVRAGHGARCDDPPVPIDVALHTSELATVDQSHQRGGSVITAVRVRPPRWQI